MLGHNLVEEIHEILAERGYKVRGDEYIYFCVFHDDRNTPNLHVNYQKEVFYCFACGEGGNLLTLAQYLGLQTAQQNESSEQILKLWSKTVPPSENMLKKVAKERGLKEETLIFAEARIIPSDDCDEFRNYMLFPIKTRLGVLQSFIGYSLVSSPKRYKKPKGAANTAPFGLDKLPLPSERGDRNFVYIVEGLFDALSAYEWGCLSIAMLGVTKHKSIFASYILPTHGFTYILAPDFDAAGQEGLYKLSLHAVLGGYISNTLALLPLTSNMPYKDFNDMHKVGERVDTLVDKGLVTIAPVSHYLFTEMLRRGENRKAIALFALLTLRESAFSLLPALELAYDMETIIDSVADAITRGSGGKELGELLFHGGHAEDIVTVVLAATSLAGRRIIEQYFLPHEMDALFSHIPIFIYSGDKIPIFSKDDVERAARLFSLRYRKLRRRNGLLNLADYIKSMLPYKGTNKGGVSSE